MFFAMPVILIIFRNYKMFIKFNMVSYNIIYAIAWRERDNTEDLACLHLQFQKLILQKSFASAGDCMSTPHCWGDIFSWRYDCAILISYLSVNGIKIHNL